MDKSVPAIKKYYNSLSRHYDKGELKEPIVQLIDDVKMIKLRKFLPKNKKARILDAGGGTGKWAIKLANLGYRNIYLVDISPGMIKEARRKFLDKQLGEKVLLFENNIENMPFDNEFFDFVIAERNVLSVANPKKTLPEVFRVMKKGAILYTSLKNYNGIKLHDRLEKFYSGKRSKLEGVSETSINFILFKPESIKKLFKENKLKILKLDSDVTFTSFVPKNELNEMFSHKEVYDKMIEFELKMTQNQKYLNLGYQLLVFAKK